MVSIFKVASRLGVEDGRGRGESTAGVLVTDSVVGDIVGVEVGAERRKGTGDNTGGAIGVIVAVETAEIEGNGS